MRPLLPQFWQTRWYHARHDKSTPEVDGTRINRGSWKGGCYSKRRRRSRREKSIRRQNARSQTHTRTTLNVLAYAPNARIVLFAIRQRQEERLGRRGDGREKCRKKICHETSSFTEISKRYQYEERIKLSLSVHMQLCACLFLWNMLRKEIHIFFIAYLTLRVTIKFFI